MKAILRSGFLALAIMALAVPGYAGPYEDADAARDRGDYATAVKIMRPLAEQGFAPAQLVLGILYAERGGGIPQDYAVAAKWFHLAAEQGQAEAQANLGYKYQAGKGVPKDYVLAYLWYNLAAARENPFAADNRDELVKRMTPDQIAEAQRMAREWMAKHRQ